MSFVQAFLRVGDGVGILHGSANDTVEPHLILTTVCPGVFFFVRAISPALLGVERRISVLEVWRVYYMLVVLP